MTNLTRFLASVWALVVAVAAGSAPIRAQPDPGSEAAAWETAQRGGTVEAFQEYLERFPLGAHSDIAFRSMVELMVEEEEGAPSRGLKVDLY
ncbi:MAG TPA: hypothetical protein VK943_14860 [Arenibaculum sp.]|nr:hypothetical protein [Arenibaculum sp.]